MDKHARPASENALLSAPLHSATSLTAEEMQLVKSQQQIRARQFAQQQSQVRNSVYFAIKCDLVVLCLQLVCM